MPYLLNYNTTASRDHNIRMFQASKNQPFEHKLHQVIISLTFSVQNKLWYLTSVNKPIKFCSSSEDFVEVV